MAVFWLPELTSEWANSSKFVCDEVDIVADGFMWMDDECLDETLGDSRVIHSAEGSSSSH